MRLRLARAQHAEFSTALCLRAYSMVLDGDHVRHAGISQLPSRSDPAGTCGDSTSTAQILAAP